MCNIRRHVQRVNRAPARGAAFAGDRKRCARAMPGHRRARDRAAPQRAQPLGRGRPACVRIAEPLVAAHQNRHRARLVVRRCSVPRRLSLNREQPAAAAATFPSIRSVRHGLVRDASRSAMAARVMSSTAARAQLPERLNNTLTHHDHSLGSRRPIVSILRLPAFSFFSQLHPDV